MMILFGGGGLGIVGLLLIMRQLLLGLDNDMNRNMNIVSKRQLDTMILKQKGDSQLTLYAFHIPPSC